jgi:hypothetical protein
VTAYSLKASLLGKIASQHLVEQEDINKKLSEESKKLNRDFNLSRAANVDLENVTPVFPKKTKCKSICMPGSSFIHIVTYK